MVKRFSDISRTLIKRSGVSNASAGRIDPNPSAQITTEIKNIAKEASNRFTDIAKTKAIKDGLRDGKIYGVTFDHNNVPQYNKAETGGMFYQNAFEEAATIEYKNSIQDNIAKKIDDGYFSWAENPENLNDMDLLRTNMASGVAGILESVPNEFRNYAQNQANNRISSNLNNEYKKLASRKFNRLNENIKQRLINLTSEIANTTFDNEDERVNIKNAFDETLKAFTKLNFGLTDVAVSAEKDFNQASNINAFISTLFHYDKNGVLVNADKIEKVASVLNLSGESVTITDKDGKDLIIDNDFVLSKYNSDAVRNMLIERINKAKASSQEKKIKYQNYIIANQETYAQADRKLTDMMNNNSLNRENFEELKNNFQISNNINKDNTNVYDDDINSNNADIAFAKQKNDIIRRGEEYFSNINKNKEAVLRDLDIETLTDSIVDSSTSVETLTDSVDSLAKQYPGNKKIIALQNLIKNEPEALSVMRAIVPKLDDDTVTSQGLQALYNAIDTGTEMKEDYTFASKTYSSARLNQLFSGYEPVKEIVLKQLADRINTIKSDETVQKSAGVKIQNILTGNGSITNLSTVKPGDIDDAFNINLENVNIPFENIHSYINVADQNQREKNIETLVGITETYMEKTRHIPATIVDYLKSPYNDLEDFKAKVEFYSHLKRNNKYAYLVDAKQYPQLEVANALPTDSKFLETYLTSLRTFITMDEGAKNASVNTFLKSLDMENPNDATEAGKLKHIRNILFKKFETDNNQIEMERAYLDLKPALLEIGTIASFHNSRQGGNLDLEKLLFNTFEARLSTKIKPTEQVVDGATNKDDIEHSLVTDGLNFSKSGQLTEMFQPVKEVIDVVGGNSLFAGSTVAILNFLQDEDINFNITDGMKSNELEKLIRNQRGRLVEKYGDYYINPEQSTAEQTRIKMNASPITYNFASTEFKAEDFFRLSDRDGDTIHLIPGKTFKLEVVKENNKIQGYHLKLFGERTTAEDANSSNYVEYSYLTNREGEKILIPLHILMEDANNFFDKAAEDELLLEAESEKSRTIKFPAEETPDLGQLQPPAVRKYKAGFTKFTPIQEGENTLSTGQKIDLDKKELAYVNLHRVVLGSNNAIINQDGSYTTAKSSIIDVSTFIDSYQQDITPVKRYIVVPNVVPYTNKNGERKYRVIGNGEQELRDDFINELGGINKFPTYNTLEAAEAGERKMKKIMEEDLRFYKGEAQPELSFTVNKGKGRDMVVAGIRYILNLTAGNNEANRRFLIGLFGTESEFGKDKRTYKPNRISTGIAQMDKIYIDKETGEEVVGVFDDLKRRHTKELKQNNYGDAGTGLPPIFGKTVKKIEDGINADFPDLLKGKKFELKTLNYNDLDNPLVSIAMARLWLATQGATSTYNNPTDAYWLYKNVYNTNLKLDTKDKFIKYYNE